MAVNYQEKLSHLSAEDVSDLMTLYYEGEKNSLLVEEYNIDIRSSLLAKTFPLKVYDDVLCKFCSIPLLSYQPSKSSSSLPNKFCKGCGHEEDSFRCGCSGCNEAREQEKKNKKLQQETATAATRDIILKTYDFEKESPVDTGYFDVKTHLYISALLRSCLSEDLKIIDSVSNSKLRLAPTSKYRRSIISVLRNENIILFSPMTNTDSVIVDEGRISQYYAENAIFEINISDSDYDEVIDSLLYLKNDFEISSEERVGLWKEIALNECLEFLDARLDEYNLPSDSIGNKTESAIKV